jgi:hypothetical protein
MSFASVRLATPNPGKTALTIERAQTLGGIYARHGANVRIGRVVAGDGAGQIYVGAYYADGKSMGRIFEKVQADPAFAKLREERELNPAATISGPDVYRVAYGQVGLGYPLLLVREYSIAYDKRAGLLALCPEVDALMKPHDVGFLGAVPAFAGDMGVFWAVYYFRSPSHLGESMDGVAMSTEFQALATKANAFGSLKRSWVLASI